MGIASPRIACTPSDSTPRTVWRPCRSLFVTRMLPASASCSIRSQGARLRRGIIGLVPLSCSIARKRRLAGVNTNANLQVASCSRFISSCIASAARHPDRVILMGLRSAKHSHDSVALALLTTGRTANRFIHEIENRLQGAACPIRDRQDYQ